MVWEINSKILATKELSMRKSVYPKETKTIGSKLLIARINNNLKLKDIAECAGISESYLSRIERNKQIPTLIVARKIANVMRLEVETRCQYCGSKIKIKK